ncbi:MAG: BamA/TamA family outer membrane protein [Sulfurovaceae bacterium]|nr:BamA/TamA family outer membrane protein [Sulfurovaceae bacterium]
MKITIYIILIFFTLLLSTKIVVAKGIDQPIAITFEGNTHIDTATLEELIGAKRPASYIFWKDDIATINELYIKKLDEIFSFFYRQEGFYNATITHKINNNGIHFKIDEKKPITIESISVESDFDISPVIYLKEHSRFRSKDFGQTKSDINKLLLKDGLCRHDLNTKAYIDLEKYSAKIIIRLKQGELCHFGKINMDGSSSIDDELILSRLHFREGDVFDLYKIKESYESLYALESFDRLHMVYDTKFTNKIPIDIHFKEIQKNTSSRIGVGYATDLNFQANYHWEYRNFYGGGRKLLFDLLFSEKQKHIENNFFNPAVLDLWGYHIDFQNSLGYKEEHDIHNFDEKVAYEKLYLQHRDDKWLHSVGLGIENIEITNDRDFFLIYPFMHLIYDLRDSKINPKEGIYFSHKMELGLPYSPDSTTYLKYLEELRLIYSLSNFTFSAVGRVGAIDIYDNRLPESKKFFAGGAFSNRAYGYDKIGITTTSSEDSDLGGSSIANLSVEVNFPIYKDIYMGIFTDSSMVSSKQEFWNFDDDIIHSVGLGVRYMTPIGPVKVDFGMNTQDYSKNGLHFQIGQSF